jgi:PAS domain S-box-containing protein
VIDKIEAFKIGIIGGGTRCKELLEAIFTQPDPKKRPAVLGVADRNPQAVGLELARQKGIYTTNDYRDLFAIEELELLLELTPDDTIKQRILVDKPPGVLLVDHFDALAVLDHCRIKAKRIELLERLKTADDPAQGALLIDEFYHFVEELNRDAHVYGRETRQELISSERALTQIINNTSIPTFVIDQNHQVTHWNRACEKLTGYTAQEMVGTSDQWKPFRSEKRPTMADLVLDEVSQEELWRLYSTRWQESALVDDAYEAEEFFPRLGEEGAWIFFTAAPIKTPEGTIIGVIETLWDRTDRRQAEKAFQENANALAEKIAQLQSSEQILAQIIGGSTIPTFVIDKDHRVTHWNRALERLSGFSAGEVIGTTRSWAPFYAEERSSMADVILDRIDEAQIWQLYGSQWRKSALIDDAYEAEAFFAHLGDEGKWCWFTAAPIKTPDGEVVGAVETIWDKTEDHKAEQEREQHTRELATYCSIYATLSSPLGLEERIRAAVEEVAGIFMLDAICIYIRRPDGRYKLRYSHGYSENLCFRNRIADEGSLVVQVAQEGHIRVIQDISADEVHEELTMLLGEGLKSVVYIPVLNKAKQSLAVIRAGGHRAQLFGPHELRSLELIANRIGVAIENALLEQDIKQRANFQAKLIGSSNNGIVATDDAGRVVIFNPAAESIFGYAEAEVVNKMHFGEICPPHVVAAFDALPSNMVTQEAGLPWSETTVAPKAGEEIPVRFCGTILRQKHKRMGLVAFFQDLREIKRLERELLGAERLAAVGQTVAGMAHCVKNILHGLKGGSYMVNIGIKNDNQEKLTAGWNMVQRNIGRTAELVQDLLSYSKERKPEMAPCRPNEIAEEVVELMQAVAAEHKVTLEAELSPEIDEVLLDQRSLHRSLLNLVSNAIDACRDDPNLGKTHRVILTTALGPGDTLQFDVSDNGSGMSDEVKAKLFSSFFSTKGPQGTGLGLLVTSKLVEEHKGAIEVESQLDRGTRFRILLPLVKA